MVKCLDVVEPTSGRTQSSTSTAGPTACSPTTTWPHGRASRFARTAGVSTATSVPSTRMAAMPSPSRTTVGSRPRPCCRLSIWRSTAASRPDGWTRTTISGRYGTRCIS